MTREQYEVYPDVLAVLAVREVKGEKRVLVTTMLDSRKTRKKDLLELYAQRWQVELDFRNIKTTLGMEVAPMPDPTDGREGAMGKLACVQSDPFADGYGVVK